MGSCRPSRCDAFSVQVYFAGSSVLEGGVADPAVLGFQFGGRPLRRPNLKWRRAMRLIDHEHEQEF